MLRQAQQLKKFMKRILFCFFICVGGVLSAQNQMLALSQLQNNGTIYTYEEKPYTGTVYEKYDNGNIVCWGEMKDGKREGKWTYWYSSGVKKRESHYVNNQKEESTYYWHENGTLTKEIIFRANQNIDQKFWDSTGTRLKNPQFEVFK